MRHRVSYKKACLNTNCLNRIRERGGGDGDLHRGVQGNLKLLVRGVLFFLLIPRARRKMARNRTMLNRARVDDKWGKGAEEEEEK